MRKIIILAAIVAIIPSHFVLAYSESTTHPALTDEIVDFYNASYPDHKITIQQKEWIIQGSRDEDTPPRWINHFYDPVHQAGWTGAKTGFIPQPVVQLLRAVGLSEEEPLSAVAWINAKLIQLRYGRYAGDRTWGRGLQYIADGQEEEAYKTLGHALHLLEDMTVPDHARDDTHAHALANLTGDSGSPYESYTSRYTRETLDIVGEIEREKALPIIKNKPEDYLIANALYSNNYFFSKDTINDPKYDLPKIIRTDENFGYNIDEDNKEFPLVRVKIIKNSGEFSKTYSLDSIQEKEILEAYFSRLARHAILTGAGMVRLFQNQARDAIENRDYPQHIVVFDGQWLSIPQFSLVGESLKAISAAQLAYASLAEAVQSAVHSVSDFSKNYSLNPFKQTADVAGNLIDVPQNKFTLQETGIDNKTNQAVASNSQSNNIPGQVKGVATVNISQKEPAISGNSPQTFSAPSPSFTQNPVGNAPTNPSSDNRSTGQAATPSTGSVVFMGISEPLQVPSMGTSSSTSESNHQSNSTTTTSDPASAASSTHQGSPAENATSSAPIFSLTGQYDKNNLIINLEWQTPIFSSSSAPTSSPAFVYDLFLDSVGQSDDQVLAVATTVNQFAYHIKSVGRTYKFLLRAKDESGQIMAQTEKTVTVESFLKELYIYPDQNATHSPASYIADLRYENPPFIPHTDGEQMFQAILFFKNRPPSDAPDGFNVSTHPNYDTHSVVYGLPVESPDCWFGGRGFRSTPLLILTTEEGLCGQFQPEISQSTALIRPSSDRLRLKISDPQESGAVLRLGDYVTVAYYDFFNGFGGYELKLKAIDEEKYKVLENPPPTIIPASPRNLAVSSFDDVHLGLNLSWDQSLDNDSAPEMIAYEINVATTTDMISNQQWQPVASATSTRIAVDPEYRQYFIHIRARDESGNISPPVALAWSFPNGFSRFVQSSRLNTAFQSFETSESESILQQIKIWTDGFLTDSGNANTNTCAISVFDSQSSSSDPIVASDTPHPADGQSDGFAYRGFGCAGDLTFTFSNSQLALLPHHRYRFMFGFPSALHGELRWYGKQTSLLPRSFSDPSLATAKFDVITSSGIISEK